MFDFYGTWRFSLVFARACHLILPWSKWIQSIIPHPVYHFPMINFSEGSSVSIVTKLQVGRPEKWFFLFATASRPLLVPTQPPLQWVSGSLSLGVKRPGRDSHFYLVPRSKNAWSFTSTLPIRLHGVVLG